MPRTLVPAILVCALTLTLFALPAVAEAPKADVVRGAEVLGDAVIGIPVDVDMATLPPVPVWRPGDPIREIPRRDDGSGRPVVDTPVRLDPLLPLQWLYEGGVSTVTEILNFEGNSSTANPNDPTGDIGGDYFVEAINGPGGSSVTIYSKVDGSLQAGPFAMDTLAPGGSACASGIGDPIVIYDHLAERWLLTEFSGGGTNRMCVYVSRTTDPTAGSWCFYEFQDTQFPDYPKYGLWPDLYLATSNQGGSGPNIYAFDRVNMLSPDGVSCPVARPPQKVGGIPPRPGLGFEALTPVDLDGPEPPTGAPAYYIRQRDEELHGDPGADPDFDLLEMWSLDVDFDNGANTVLTTVPPVVVSDFDSNLCPPVSVFSCVPQPGGGPPLDPLLEVVMHRASYRNFGTHELILGVIQTDINDFPDHSGERWFELRKVGAGPWTLFQEGTWSPDAEGRFMGMTAMDASGNILLGYNVSSTTVFPSIRYTGRKSSDPLGVMTEPEVVMAPGGGVNNSSRYGDYNQMGVDPIDGCTFWFLGMYNPSGKGVRIAAAKFDSCNLAEIFSDGFESGDFSAWSGSEP